MLTRSGSRQIAQAWPVPLDEGIYPASVSTMYRVRRAADQVRERRAQAPTPPGSAPS